MSLLMEALRKAEQQKRQQAEQGSQGGAPQPVESGQPPPATSGATKLELVLEEPSPTRSPLAKPASKGSGKPLPELPTRLEELDEQFMVQAAQPATKPKPPEPPPTLATSAPTPASAASEEAAREGARNLFAAKQAPRHDGHRFAYAMGGLVLVGVVGIGAWFWWQLQPKGGLAVAPSASSAPVGPSAAVAPPAASQPAVPPTPTFAAPAPQAAAVAPTAPPAAPPVALAAGAPTVETPPPPPRPTREPVTPPAPESPIRISKATVKINPLIEEAWQAFQRGEIELARAAWQKALSADPLNADALHGLAAVALRNGRPELAADYYLRALEADPRDALALSGLVSLKAPADTQAMESRLKTLLSGEPDSPYLNFALGNLYARAARWAEAQQAFFRAHVADPGHPDYLFNLAVSLDQLHQNRLAIEHYQRALAAAEKQAASFDAAQAAARLKALQAGE